MMGYSQRPPGAKAAMELNGFGSPEVAVSPSAIGIQFRGQGKRVWDAFLRKLNYTWHGVHVV